MRLTECHFKNKKERGKHKMSWKETLGGSPKRISIQKTCRALAGKKWLAARPRRGKSGNSFWRMASSCFFRMPGIPTLTVATALSKRVGRALSLENPQTRFLWVAFRTRKIPSWSLLASLSLLFQITPKQAHDSNKPMHPNPLCCSQWAQVSEFQAPPTIL